MRNKTRQFSRTQRILLSCLRTNSAVMRAQTFSVCAKPQGARPAHTNFFPHNITLALTSSFMQNLHNYDAHKHQLNAFTSRVRVRYASEDVLNLRNIGTKVHVRRPAPIQLNSDSTLNMTDLQLHFNTLCTVTQAELHRYFIFKHVLTFSVSSMKRIR